MTKTELFALKASYGLLVKAYQVGALDLSYSEEIRSTYDCIVEELGEPGVTVPTEDEDEL